ncbi:MAG: hypothetical protein DMD26_17620 [Gemmatimonadetes bacterium]|nr:MAG: hypothetical protein DMD26_17620 [Gemmatimonadota bacterium]
MCRLDRALARIAANSQSSRLAHEPKHRIERARHEQEARHRGSARPLGYATRATEHFPNLAVDWIGDGHPALDPRTKELGERPSAVPVALLRRQLNDEPLCG